MKIKFFGMTIVTAILLISMSKVLALTLPPLGIGAVGKEIDEVRDEIIRHINIAKTTDIRPLNGEWQGEYHQMYSTGKIYDITEFYFPTVKIEGYELTSILIDQWTFMYYYVTIKELQKLQEDSNYVFTSGSWILFGIDRPHWIDNDDPLKAEIENREHQNIEFVLKDNLLYTESQNSIEGQIGNTRFNIRVPDELNNFEFLRDLSLEIIETSELIVLDNISAIAPETGDNIGFIIILIAGVILNKCFRKNVNFKRI